MYIRVADRRVSAKPSGKRDVKAVGGKRQCQGGNDVESCVGGTSLPGSSGKGKFMCRVSKK